MSRIELKFDDLRKANALRLPQFKNGKGEPAHSKPDGSDWSPAMWLIAMMGETGELSTELQKGSTHNLKKELADVQTYLDILALRSLDTYEARDPRNTMEDTLLACIESLGKLCELHKKFTRGDIAETTYRDGMYQNALEVCRSASLIPHSVPDKRYRMKPHPTGVDLGLATAEKFNDVSERVGSDVRIAWHGVVCPSVDNE